MCVRTSHIRVSVYVRGFPGLGYTTTYKREKKLDAPTRRRRRRIRHSLGLLRPTLGEPFFLYLHKRIDSCSFARLRRRFLGFALFLQVFEVGRYTYRKIVCSEYSFIFKVNRKFDFVKVRTPTLTKTFQRKKRNKRKKYFTQIKFSLSNYPKNH